MTKVYDEHQDICPDCNGEGCNECDGTGFLVEEPAMTDPCPECRGSGQVYLNEYGDDSDEDICHVCQGTGVVEE